MAVYDADICYIYIIIKTDMNASWMLVYLIIRWWSQGKIIRMSQGKIFVKDTFIMPISILYSLIMYSIITKNKFYIKYI